MLVWLRSLLFSLGYFPITVIYGTFTLLLFPLPPKVRHRIIIAWCSLVVAWLKIACGIRYTVTGKDHLQALKTPFIIMSKHQSAWETVFLQNFFFPASTVLKKELLNIPFFGWGLRGLQPIAIDRSNPKLSLKQVKTGGLSTLEKGNNMLLFPEGTRVAPGTKGKYARSGADIAITANTPIVPVAHNAGYFWPINQFRKYPGNVSVIIGPPIYPEGKTSREITEEVESWIESQMQHLTL